MKAIRIHKTDTPVKQVTARATRQSPSKVPDELRDWLWLALRNADMGQAELGRRLTERLGRTIDRAAINKMTKGLRTLLADEMLAISVITDQPLPQFVAPGKLASAPKNAEVADSLTTYETPTAPAAVEAPAKPQAVATHAAIDESTLQSLFAGAMAWAGMDSDSAASLTAALIEFSRTASNQTTAPLGEDQIRLQAETLARLFLRGPQLVRDDDSSVPLPVKAAVARK